LDDLDLLENKYLKENGIFTYEDEELEDMLLEQ
jgi:hypothetical protein